MQVMKADVPAAIDSSILRSLFKSSEWIGRRGVDQYLLFHFFLHLMMSTLRCRLRISREPVWVVFGIES